MNLFYKLSLRMRMTLLTGLIVFAASLGLTLISMYNARTQFVSVSLLQDSIAAIELTESTNTQAATPSIPATPLEQTTLVPKDGGAMAITVKAIPAPVLAAKKEFDVNSFIYLLVTSAVGMMAAYFVSGRALKPMRELNRATLHITGDNLTERIPESGAADEIGSLSRSFNGMLDRLEQSFQRQKRFSANVAHELKTPLATMNAGIQVLRLDDAPTVEDCLETLGVAERNVKRLMDIVNDLFLLTDERTDDYADDIPLRALFDEMIGELSPLYLEKRLTIACELPMERLTGNRTLTQRMLFNLVENAMKYSYAGGVVTIRADDGKITVSNAGAEIPAADLGKIFEPFYRVDQSRSRKVGGAGLGLSIVKSIAEKHGWTVAAESSTAETVITVTVSQ